MITRSTLSSMDGRALGDKQAGSWAHEQELLAQARQGSEDAFRALFELHQRHVYLLCLQMTKNPVEAEDLCQDAFLLFFRKLSTFRGESALSTWLHRLAVNVVLMHWRRKSIPLVPLGNPDKMDARTAVQYGMTDKRLTHTLDRLNLKRAIQKLAPGYRRVFILHEIEGYKHDEIAKLINRSTGNCKSQLHKARRKLRDLLRPGGLGPSPCRDCG